jgi:crotonobetainyl-CoA:carnitine CoA-transferase CaiB-like acyl-CoA transferase
MDRERLLDDPRFADPNTRAVNRAALTDALDPTFRTRTTAAWLATFNGLLPAAPVYRLDQALDSASPRDRHGLGRAASGEGQPARHRQSPPHRRRAAGAGRLLAARRRQRLCWETHMKLEGIKVVDLSWFLPGPYLTTALADHGAEVIKVEPPATAIPAATSGRRRAHVGVLPQHGARQEERRARPQERAGPRRSVPPVQEADVIVESFRPGVAARFGIAYEAVKAGEPGIVYCSISAFGQDGAYPGRARTISRSRR